MWFLMSSSDTNTSLQEQPEQLLGTTTFYQNLFHLLCVKHLHFTDCCMVPIYSVFVDCAVSFVALISKHCLFVWFLKLSLFDIIRLNTVLVSTNIFMNYRRRKKTCTVVQLLYSSGLFTLSLV